MNLRPHQEKAIRLSRESFSQGHKHIALCACVSSGKTLIAKHMIEGALSKGLKVGFFSFRVVLIEQLKKYFEDAPDITIGTIQLHGKKGLDLDFAIFDEKDFYGTKLRNNIRATRSITLSGTPTDENGNALDFDDIIDVIQIPELIANGYAKPIRVLSTSKIDTSNLKKVGKDFHKGQSFQMMDKASIKKDLVDVYKKHCIGRKSIMFAVDTKHAESLKDEFISSGVACDTAHSKKNRDSINAFERGDFDLLINVMQLTTGYDFPEINTVIFARPCASLPLMIQCIGRGIRLNPDKPNDECLVIDCAEVIKRVNFHPMQKIDLTKTKKSKVKKCKQCEKDMYIISKKVIPVDKLTYKSLTTYKCDCGNWLEDENYHVINFNFCSSCEEVLTDKNISMKETNKAIEFTIKCECCGTDNIQRKILLTDAELKEIEYQETINGKDTWNKAKILLRELCKANNYHHRYAVRLVESLQNKNKKIEEVMQHIKNIQKGNMKLARLMYV